MPASKETILKEIKRLAAANGGIALGADRFEAEAGISRNEWLAKHWEKWSDALKEAGLNRQGRSRFQAP